MVYNRLTRQEMYIHQLPAWPKYTYDAEVLLPLVEDANTRRGRLFGILDALGFVEMKHHEVEAITEELIKSSAIEGEHLDVESVKHSVAHRLGLETGGVAGKDRYVDGLVEMAVDASQNCGEPLDAERIFRWHAALFPTGRNLYGAVKVGGWREDSTGPMVVASYKGQKEVVHFEAPSADRLDAEMAEFLGWIEAESETSLVLKAGIAHIWFETIHPLDDGNGRVGRNIMELLLARADQMQYRPYSLSRQIHKERTSYYNILEKTQRGTLDYTDWLIWYLNALTAAIDDASLTIGKTVERSMFWQRIKDIELSERQRKAISRMLMGWEGRMTNRKYAALTNCSDSTATRDLTDLVAKQILQTDGAGGRSTGYELVKWTDEDS